MIHHLKEGTLEEKAVLVGLIHQNQSEEKVIEYLAELEFLSQTAGAKVLKTFTQKLSHPDKRYFIGSGKLQEIKEYVELNDINLIIFDDDLSPSQTFNIEKELTIKIVDRSFLILDIFANRAQTAQAKAQVELAQLQYMLPRLRGMWTHLGRQRGGIGMRGPGEKEIETDRRIVNDKVAKLKKELEKIDKQNQTRRKGRDQMIRVALVGYTNVGKSTLMNVISKSEVFAENKLFATLDTTVRKVVLGNLPFLLSDTVGFIRKLPTQLVESFKSTLDEVREADMLLHVVDISHPQFEEQIDSVNKILGEIKSSDKKTIMIFNKIDRYEHETIDSDDLVTEKTEKHFTIEEWKKTWMQRVGKDAIFISALNKENLDEFRKRVYDEVREIHVTRFPYNNFLYPEHLDQY